jgi:hypothetical protein
MYLAFGTLHGSSFLFFSLFLSRELPNTVPTYHQVSRVYYVAEFFFLFLSRELPNSNYLKK